MRTHFKVTVEMADGKILNRAATAVNGLETPEKLEEHYRKFNVFPDAKSIKIEPVSDEQEIASTRPAQAQQALDLAAASTAANPNG